MHQDDIERSRATLQKIVDVARGKAIKNASVGAARIAREHAAKNITRSSGGVFDYTEMVKSEGLAMLAEIGSDYATARTNGVDVGACDGYISAAINVFLDSCQKIGMTDEQTLRAFGESGTGNALLKDEYQIVHQHLIDEAGALSSRTTLVMPQETTTDLQSFERPEDVNCIVRVDAKITVDGETFYKDEHNFIEDPITIWKISQDDLARRKCHPFGLHDHHHEIYRKRVEEYRSAERAEAEATRAARIESRKLIRRIERRLFEGRSPNMRAAIFIACMGFSVWFWNTILFPILKWGWHLIFR